jgi:hypothetical protein
MSEPGAVPATPAPVATLAYALPAHAKPRVVLYRIAQVCWGLPLAVGVATLALYAVTSASSLTGVGLLTLSGGAVLLGIGVVCLIVFLALLRRCAPDVRSRWTRRGFILLGLLVLNIPVAMGCAAVGIWLMNRFTVTVTNRSETPVENLQVQVPGHTWDAGTVAPGATVSRTFSVNGRGDLAFIATHRGRQVVGQAGGYLAGFESRAQTGSIVFTADGESASIRGR